MVENEVAFGNDKTEGIKKKRAPRKAKKLIRVGPEVSFYFCDGKCSSDLKEFSKALDEISQDVFNYHVNSEKNDFANWIEDIFGEKTLAKKLRKKTDKNYYVIELVKFTAKLK